jgi:hypothetical protein
MPKLDNAAILMRAQALEPEKSKTLLVFLTSFCSGNDLFIKALHAGLRHLERMSEISSAPEAKQ